jgi:hypothetical protein
MDKTVGHKPFLHFCSLATSPSSIAVVAPGAGTAAAAATATTHANTLLSIFKPTLHILSPAAQVTKRRHFSLFRPSTASARLIHILASRRRRPLLLWCTVPEQRPICMAVRLLQTHDVSDLCIGKPALRWLPPTSTVADAAAELEGAGAGAAVAVWDGDEASDVAGRVRMADVLLFLCAAANLASPAAALQATLSDLLAAAAPPPPPVRRIEPDARLHVYLSLDRHVRRDARVRLNEYSCSSGSCIDSVALVNVL